jgi:serine/threonine-protein kinase PknG
MTSSTTTACGQPGCAGTILDGYCDVCGSPAVPASGPAAGPASGTAAAGSLPIASTGSTMSRSSNRLAADPFGSQRTRPTAGPSRRQNAGSQRLRARRLGAGLTTVPPRAPVDAATALMTDPVLEEDKRFCPACGSPVGRSVGGRPGRVEGFCPKCAIRYSFTPKLGPGDLVAGQYQVAGALAHGGLGWIYLAQDRNVADRWVVLKGLLNSGDADALAAAIAERQFLAQVEHPLVVEIYNFVTHEGAGYIVMEYVGGTSLKQLLKERMRAAGRYDALPLDQAIAFIVEILPAFGYLHDQGLAYCDFKPDNIIQIGDDVKLIDLGGVRRLDDQDSAIYGTVGYQAPEVPDVGTTVASDVFTIGRTLLVLAMEFRGYQSTYLYALPPVADTPLFQRYDSFYRLVAKACAPDPDDRFATVDELRVQLLGVLREVVATDRPGTTAALHAPPSVLFHPPNVAADSLTWADLPGLVRDAADPQIGWLSTLSVEDPAERLDLLGQAPERSPEVLLEIGRAALLAGRPEQVGAVAEELLAADPWEWRAVWLRGLQALHAGDGAGARSAFNAVYGQVPGELAPKLALALACETSGEPDVAEALYTVCARSDAAYRAPAAFGLARIRIGRQDVPGTVAALDLVPDTSRAWTPARRLRAQRLAHPEAGLESLADALTSIDGVDLDPADRARLTAGVLASALAQVHAAGPRPDLRIGPHPAAEPSLRDGLESAYRALAALVPTADERVRLVDEANAVRRWTIR